jgi:hypothetical protein
MNPALNPARSIKAAESASCAHGVCTIPGAASRALRFFAGRFARRSRGHREREACFES